MKRRSLAFFRRAFDDFDAPRAPPLSPRRQILRVAQYFAFAGSVISCYYAIPRDSFAIASAIFPGHGDKQCALRLRYSSRRYRADAMLYRPLYTLRRDAPIAFGEPMLMTRCYARDERWLREADSHYAER
jgi:hypothetical protein